MSLIRWNRAEYNPFRELLDIQKEVNRLLDTSLDRSTKKGQTLAEATWSPSVDVYDNKDKLVIKADLPGLTQKDIDISVDSDILRIKGEKKKESEVKEDNYYRLERDYGYFERSFSLPANVDSAQIKASYKDGVLKVILPKGEEKKTKQVKINIE